MKERYHVFKDILEREEKRRDELLNRIKIYLSILTFYLGAIAFSLKDIDEILKTESDPWVYGFWVMTLVFLMLPFIFVILALVNRYTGFVPLDEIVSSGELDEPNDDQFYLSRMVDMSQVHDSLIGANNKIATNLLATTITLFLGIASSFGLFVFILK